MPPLTDKQKEYHKKYREEHKKEIQEYKKEYREEHKQEIQEYNKKNEARDKEARRKYREGNGKKVRKINDWKQSGVIHDDYDELYDKYINSTECELCNIPITEGKGIIGKKHLDHDHETGEFRNILCGHCNVKIMRFK